MSLTSLQPFRGHRASVCRMSKHVSITGSLKDKMRTGRPRKTSERDDRLMQGIARQRPFVTAKGIKETVTKKRNSCQ